MDLRNKFYSISKVNPFGKWKFFQILGFLFSTGMKDDVLLPSYEFTLDVL